MGYMAPTFKTAFDYGTAQSLTNCELQYTQSSLKPERKNSISDILPDPLLHNIDQCSRGHGASCSYGVVDVGIRHTFSTLHVASISTLQPFSLTERQHEHCASRKDSEGHRSVLGTIWQYAERTNTNRRSKSDVDLHGSANTYGVFSSPQIDDWHIIYSFDDAQQPLSKENSFPEPCRRSSKIVCCDEIRYLRCGKSELLDATCWLSWQQSIARDVPPRVFGNWEETYDACSGLSDQELNHCKNVLMAFLYSRSIEDLQLILLALYFANHSFRSLLTTEWTAAIRSIAYAEPDVSSSLNTNYSGHMQDNDLLAMCNPLLKADHDGKIVFQEAAMKKYLRLVDLPGLEHGHGMMTKMCFAQIKKLGTRLIVRPWHSFRRWLRSYAEWPLLNYVSNFWFSHYKLAAESRHDLTAELFRMVNDALVGQDPASTPVWLQQNVVDVGFSIARQYDLPQLADMYCNMGASESYQMPDVVHPHITSRPWNLTHDVRSVHQATIYNETCENESRFNSSLGRDEGSGIASRLQNMHLYATAPQELQNICQLQNKQSADAFAIPGDWESVEATTVFNEPEGYSPEGSWEWVADNDLTFYDHYTGKFRFSQT